MSPHSECGTTTTYNHLDGSNNLWIYIYIWQKGDAGVKGSLWRFSWADCFPSGIFDSVKAVSSHVPYFMINDYSCSHWKEMQGRTKDFLIQTQNRNLLKTYLNALVLFAEMQSIVNTWQTLWMPLQIIIVLQGSWLLCQFPYKTRKNLYFWSASLLGNSGRPWFSDVDGKI